MLTVTITHRHTLNTSFHYIKGCALQKAMQEQYPELKIKKVLYNFMQSDTDLYYFDASPATGYHQQSFNQLRKGIIKQLTIQFDILNEIPDEEQLFRIEKNGQAPGKASDNNESYVAADAYSDINMLIVCDETKLNKQYVVEKVKSLSTKVPISREQQVQTAMSVSIGGQQ